MEESKSKEVPCVDYEKCFDYIVENTGIDRELVMKVIDAETEYLIKIGVIKTE